jgi:type VI secretion system protein ImpG
MDPRLLEYYNQELQFVREMGAEFAKTYPRVAARLGVDGIECADPYVERLLESFAFLTARVQLKIDARHPDFTQHLLQMVYPHFLCPVPSMAVAEFAPDLKDSGLAAGVRIPRGSTLRTQLAKGDRTACEFRTAHDVTLWPLTITDAKYLSGSGPLTSQGLTVDGKVRAAIRLRLRVTAGAKLKELPLESLDFFIKAPADVAYRVHEQVIANNLGFYVRPLATGAPAVFRPTVSVDQLGLDDDESLLPVTHGSFSGYRLLQEYFAFPERLLFFRLRDLAGTLRNCESEEFEIYLLLDRAQTALDNALDPTHFRLYSTPIVNLFPKELDRMHLAPHDTEHHIVPDRNRPMDFEIYSISKVGGIGVGSDDVTEVSPFYSVSHRNALDDGHTYYTLQRRQRLYSNRQSQRGARSSYIGTECFLSLVDSREREAGEGVRHVDVIGYCTNRDLPIMAPFGKGKTDFLLEGAAPLDSIRLSAGPTYPRPSPAFGDTAWRLISHLTLNYLSLLDSPEHSGADMLREMLSLYADSADTVALRQIEGVTSITHKPVIRRIPVPGPISYGRGLQIDVTLDDAAFEGAGVLPLAAVLERFFARYVSLNSFTQLRLVSQTRGEIKLWPVRLGNRLIL